MRWLFGRRALVAIVLLMAVGVALAVSSHFYTWTKYYKISPLTSNERIRLPEISGATVGWVINYTDAVTNAPVNAVLPMIVAPYALPPEFIKEVEVLGLVILEIARDYPSTPPKQYPINEFLADPPAVPYWNGKEIPYSTKELMLLNETKYRLINEFNFSGVVWALSVPRLRPVYHETLHLPQKSYVYFLVLTDDISKLLEHYAWLIEMEYIFHPGDDGELGTEDDYLYAIVLIPLVNPWQKPGSGLAQILLDKGKYGVIKTTFYWTKAVTEEVSHSFTIHVWAHPEIYETPPPS
ncbi:MAG: hypothetical protein QW791_08840 [Candidatus Bathyarchaeia archaeon]